MRLFAADLVLLHPPSVYDFRRRSTLFGPVSDLVPSTPVFEMYPMGLTTIAAYLENEGYNVEIVNVAHRMLVDPNYDAEREISKLKPALFGVDLHWLPHAHGALELARIAKRYHPDIPIIFGGVSASYYYRELIEYPWVDLVMRGDSTEQPLLFLLRSLRLGGPLSAVPNLTWKRADGTVVVNELSHVPESIDHLSIPNYLYTMRSVFKYGSLANVLPYVDWLDYPITALLTSRGCTLNCAVCGGSEFAYQRIFNRRRPAFRSPEALVKDILLIQEFSRAPIFLIHDLRQGGEDHFRRFMELLSRERIENEVIFELFFPAGRDYFSAITKAVPRFSLEITLESHVEELRERNGKLACSNEEIEATIGEALRSGVNRIDLFFMVGMPWQTYGQAVEAVDYCRHVLQRFHGDRRLCFFNAPLAPFLDPGSLAFESPDEYGYRRLRSTLEEHRRALTAPSWKHVLNYETVAMSRDDIVRATYEAGVRLARLKLDFGIIDQETHDRVVAKIEASRTAVDEIDRILQIPEGPERRARLAALGSTVDEMSVRTLGAKRELKWPIPSRFGRPVTVTRLLLRLLLIEAYLLFFKRAKLLIHQAYWRVRGKENGIWTS